MATPFDTAALTVLALCMYPADKAAALDALDHLRGPRPMSVIEKQFIADRFEWMDEKVGYQPITDDIADMRATLPGRIHADGQGIRLVGFPQGCTYRVATANGQFVAQ